MTDDEHHEAYGAMVHAMKPRDYHREIADERDKLRAENEQLTRENGELRKTIMANAHDAERQVATLREALNWFADKNNWREEQLSEGYVYSAEWRVGFSPIDIATRALAKETLK